MADGDQPFEATGDNQTEIAVDRLMRALGRLSRGDADSAYRAIVEIGPRAIPRIQHVLYRSDLKRLLRPEVMEILTTLMCLIHDLDEAKSQETAAELIRNGCHHVYKARLETILRFNSDNYVTYVVEGISIRESKSLKLAKNRAKLLKRWLGNVGQADLRHIKQIYLIPNDKSFDYRGQYAPNLCKIVLVWDNPFRRWSPLSWVFHLRIELTLYHEIGHHVHRHTYGQDPEQEEQADAYAARMMKVGHPALRRLGRIIFAFRGRQSRANCVIAVR